MMTRCTVERTCWLVIAALITVSVPAAAHQRPQHEETVIENVTLISPERTAPLPHATVVIREGKIAAVGTGLSEDPRAHRIDGTGRFLIPGLIDSHVHVGASAALDEAAIQSHPDLWAAYREQVP